MQGDYKQDFLEANPEFRDVKPYSDLFRQREKKASAIMWYIRYMNSDIEPFFSMSHKKRQETLMDILELADRDLSVKVVAAAQAAWRQSKVSPPLRYLIAMKQKIGEATVLLEETPLEGLSSVKDLNGMMKEFRSLKEEYRDAVREFEESKTEGAIPKNQLVSGSDTGEAWQDYHDGTE